MRSTARDFLKAYGVVEKKEGCLNCRSYSPERSRGKKKQRNQKVRNPNNFFEIIVSKMLDFNLYGKEVEGDE